MTPAELRKLAQAAQGRPGAESYKARRALLASLGYSDPTTALRVADLWEAALMVLNDPSPDYAKIDAALDAMKGESDE